MSTVTVCYSTHRPETLELTAGLMTDHDVIILEEPFHPDFQAVLSGSIEIEEHLLELDIDYPAFMSGQYRLLQQLSQDGKEILQVEPYLDLLIGIQYFLAEDHTPEEIEPGTPDFSVYQAERDATGKLINYYKEVRGNDFSQILASMNTFAKADAARFILRDTLRAKRIMELLNPDKAAYIEAGSIHLLLHKLLAKNLSEQWQLQTYSIDRQAMHILNCKGTLFSPGDELTLSYIFGQDIGRRTWQLLCAQSLIYSKIVQKTEIVQSNTKFPHTLNELESISVVKQLSIEACKTLFQQTRPLLTEEAADLVKNHVNKQNEASI